MSIERPILFSAAMLPAIMAGHKTQTRRALKPQPPLWGTRVRSGVVRSYTPDAMPRCPYGVPGDRLWVRERARVVSVTSGHEPWYAIEYAADGRCTYRHGILPGKWFPSRNRNAIGEPLWCSPIHMPRWASRLTLIIETVRVELLRDITKADAIAEGYPSDAGVPPGEWYADLWERINGPGSWASNPWVWVITIRRPEEAL